jgi:carbon-monoxide dehydrogenase large subunit
MLHPRALNSVIGTSTVRSEGAEKVTGRAIYATDVMLPGMLWAKVLRSPIAYGRIKHIDVSRARALPGVHAVVTGADVQGRLIGRKIYDMPILAHDGVRFAGEKIAGVAAKSEEIAEAAVELIEVEYEEWAPLLDPLAALQPSAPLLHPAVQSYRGLLHSIEKPSNVFVDLSWKKGDVDAGFCEADLILENTFTTSPVHQGYLEPHSCVVQAENTGGAQIWACSKVPFALREQVAKAFGRGAEDFIMRPCYIGGCFGGKGDFMDVPLCYLLSRESGRPVKMVMDYAEEFLAGNPRHAAVIKVKTGVKKDGTLVAHRMEFVYDSGAYAAFKPQGYLVGPQEAAGPYRIPNVFINEKLVYTNKVPCGHMRAPGDPQGFFANESQMDLLARRLGIDPLAFRRKNLMRDGDVSPIGHPVPHLKSDEIVGAAVGKSGYAGPKRKHTGRGMAIAQWLPLGGKAHALVSLDEQGDATVSAAMVDQGAGTYTALRQIAAQELRLPIDKVAFHILDTSQASPDTGIGASRGTRIFGHATLAAAVKVKEALLEAASQMLGAPRQELSLTGRAVVRANRGREITYREIIRKIGAPVCGAGEYDDFTNGPQAALCVQIAEVEVDVTTGRVAVIRLTTAHSTGTVLNPLTHQGQIEGGVLMGLGYATMEGLSFDGGRVSGLDFGANKFPSIKDIPGLRTIIQEYPVGNGPYGAMSIGEPPVIPTAAAIANAIDDAVGARVYDLPMTAEKILTALRRRSMRRVARSSGS